MTHIERLLQAERYIKQLADGWDPLTGQPLPDSSAAREERVYENLRWCGNYVKMMVAEDAPDLAAAETRRWGHGTLARTDAVLYSAMDMENLAQGRHPYTSVPLRAGDPLMQEELRECFAFVGRALNNSLLAGYYTAKAPFSLPRGANVPISPAPVELPRLLEEINALREDDTAVRPLTDNTLEPYLASQGLLEEVPGKGVRREYAPTTEGRARGFTQEERPGACAVLICAPQAQEYVAEHIEDLAAYLADPSRWTPSRKGLPVRQIDVLKRARDYLDRLSCCWDPLTGERFSHVSAAQEERVHQLLVSCVQDLNFMILRDEPQLHPDGSRRIAFYFPLKGAGDRPRIKTRDALAESIFAMERLARGCRPDTGEPLAPQDPLVQERLRKCFGYVARFLRSTYIAGQYTAMSSFFLSEEDRAGVHISEEPVTTATLVGRINARLKDRTAILGISSISLCNYLVSQDLLRANGQGKYKTYRPTPAGERLGIRMETFDEEGRESYTALAFDADGQRYVVNEGLSGVMAAQAVYDERTQERLSEKLRALEEKSRAPERQAPAQQAPIQQDPAFRKAPVPETLLPGEETPTVKQLDRLREAEACLKQLADGRDPLAGGELPDDSAARGGDVRKLFSSCLKGLGKMIRFDAGGGKHSTIKETEFWQQNARDMEALAQGRRLEGGAPLDGEDPLAREELRRHFALVALALRHALGAGYFTAKAPFALPPEARQGLVEPRESMAAADFLKKINARLEDDTAVMSLTAPLLRQYLASQDLLTELPGKAGQKTYEPTPQGEALGIVRREAVWKDNEKYKKIFYSPAAQQFVVDHLDDIIAFRAEK